MTEEAFKKMREENELDLINYKKEHEKEYADNLKYACMFISLVSSVVGSFNNDTGCFDLSKIDIDLSKVIGHPKSFNAYVYYYIDEAKIFIQYDSIDDNYIGIPSYLEDGTFDLSIVNKILFNQRMYINNNLHNDIPGFSDELIVSFDASYLLSNRETYLKER